MKTVKLKHLCILILICVFVINAFAHTLVHAASTIPGVQRLQEGIAAYGHGEYDDAIFKLEMAVYQISVDDKDNLWDAHFYLGLSYLLIGDATESTKQFTKAQGLIKTKSPDVLMHSPKVVKLFKEASKFLKDLGGDDERDGSIVVESDPRGAMIFLDDDNVGTTPDSIRRIVPGKHKVEVKMEEYKTWTKWVNIKAGDETYISSKLENEITGKAFKAAKAGNIISLKKLIELGSDFNIKDEKGWFPLMHAVYGGHNEAIRLLLKAGCINEWKNT